MKFYKSLEKILLTQKPSEKSAHFRDFYVAYKAGDVTFEEAYTPLKFTEPSYASFCEVVPPLKVPRRNKFTTDAGKRLLLHAIIHIEYSAVDLALDHAYRFKDLPKAYYDDWLVVVEDEIRHYEMLNALLEELGGHYGETPVHDSLFEASQRTQTLLDRMAVVPRHLEANGLDATPGVLKRLENIKSDVMLEKIKVALRVILDEEIEHVSKGDRWFHYACEKEGVSPESFFEIIQNYYPGTFPKKGGINVEARKEAGFSCSDMKQILVGHECE